MNQTELDRWKQKDSYLANWQERSQFMIGLLDETISASANLTFTEYGCGPNAPISKVLLPSGRACKRYDIKAWDADCSVVDLNDSDFQVDFTEVAVMSGVAEYMNDLKSTLSRLKMSHDYLLISYHPFGQRRLFRFQDPIKELNKRSHVNGWRNHFAFPELVQVIGTSAFPLRMVEYKRQVLMLWKFIK